MYLPQAVHAQAGNESRWGVSLSFTPKWEISDQVRDLMFDEEEEGRLKGTKFTVGFVRGNQRGVFSSSRPKGPWSSPPA
jgi:hypothetical protein